VTSKKRAEEMVPEFQPNGSEKVVCVVFCSPSAETIHQGFGAHYTPILAKKENGNGVSKTICAVSQQIVINALSGEMMLLRQVINLTQIAQFSRAQRTVSPLRPTIFSTVIRNDFLFISNPVTADYYRLDIHTAKPLRA
jgi:hypothetical protein